MLTMWRGLWKLTWLEIKIFRREPMGAFGSVLFPVLVFVILGRVLGGRVTSGALSAATFLRVGLPVFASILIVLSAVLSLVTIIRSTARAASSSGCAPRPCAR